MRGRWILWSIGAIVAIGTALCALAGAVLCETAVHPARRAVPSNASALTVQVTARDGVVLRAWLLKPEKPNGDVVLILHGIADSRASQVGLARMFVNH
jgi:alpha-beta hydrolase superfamily lysophospholipase